MPAVDLSLCEDDGGLIGEIFLESGDGIEAFDLRIIARIPRADLQVRQGRAAVHALLEFRHRIGEELLFAEQILIPRI